MSEKFEVGESPGEKTPSQSVEKLDVREIKCSREVEIILGLF